MMMPASTNNGIANSVKLLSPLAMVRTAITESIENVPVMMLGNTVMNAKQPAIGSAANSRRKKTRKNSPTDITHSLLSFLRHRKIS